MKENVTIKIKQIWCSFDDEFVVEQYKEVNGETWVYYKNVKTGQEYSCLEGAFRSRFYPVVNKG